MTMGKVETVCRVSSGACGLPLWLDFVIVLTLTFAAWSLIFAGCGCLGVRVRSRLQGACFCGGGLLLLGIAALVWGWDGSNPLSR
jgi:hypothetical protein